MGKNEFLTPKAIANRIKAKGLQKLKWYCQMCQKQCRDENGFKCHCMSEGHQRQMQVFGDNPHRFIDGFSQEFEEMFMEHLKRSHRSSRVAATVVWNEYIADRHHIHMNSTKWATLTEFVKYLGREGKCKVDETPKGWFMTYIDREPETLLREGLKLKRDRAELADEERHEKAIEQQIERAARNSNAEYEQPAPEGTEMVKQEGEKIGFALGASKPKARAEGLPPLHNSTKFSAFAADGEDDATKPSKKAKRDTSNGKDVLGQIMREAEQGKEKVNRKDYWLCEGLVVKVMTRNLADYYKQKGVVQRVIGKYVGEVEMLETKHVLKVDQQELETVIPQIGGVIRIVNGAYRGSSARLLSIDTARFNAKVRIENGAFDGRTVTADYEDICKLAS